MFSTCPRNTCCSAMMRMPRVYISVDFWAESSSFISAWRSKLSSGNAFIYNNNLHRWHQCRVHAPLQWSPITALHICSIQPITSEHLHDGAGQNKVSSPVNPVPGFTATPYSVVCFGKKTNIYVFIHEWYGWKPTRGSEHLKSLKYTCDAHVWTLLLQIPKLRDQRNCMVLMHVPSFTAVMVCIYLSVRFLCLSLHSGLQEISLFDKGGMCVVYDQTHWCCMGRKRGSNCRALSGCLYWIGIMMFTPYLLLQTH